MEYFNNQLCISPSELEAVMTPACYDKLVNREKVTVARPGKGRGNYALVVVDSLPDKYKEKVNELYPEGGAMKLHEWFRNNYKSKLVSVVIRES